MNRGPTKSPTWIAASAIACVAFSGCNGAQPKPLPGGPPPEYEQPRSYDGGVGETPSAPASSTPAADAGPPF